MTKRSCLYFKFKWAYRTIGTAKGRAYLAAKGIYPISMEASGTFLTPTACSAYMINKKGNIVGTSNPKRPANFHVTVPKQVIPTHYTFKIEFKSAEDLVDL